MHIIGTLQGHGASKKGGITYNIGDDDKTEFSEDIYKTTEGLGNKTERNGCTPHVLYS